DGIASKSVDAEVEPEPGDAEHLVPDRRIVKVDNRLMLEKAGPVALLCNLIERPVRRLGIDEDDPGVAVSGRIVGPDEVIPLGRVAIMARFLKPRVCIGAVVHDEVDKNLQPTFVRGLDQATEVIERSEVWMDPREIGDVVAVVKQRRGIKRLHPDAVDTKVPHVIEAHRHAGEVALAVVIRVVERSRVELVEDRVLVPQGIMLLVRQNPVPSINSMVKATRSTLAQS